MTASATLSVIIPTLGDKKKLQTLLNSLQQQILSEEFITYIVDNSLQQNEDSLLTPLLSTYSLKIEYLKSNNKGVNYARNMGLLSCRSDLVLYLDDDCWIRDRHLLSRHMTYHQQNSQVFAIGGFYHLPIGKGIFDRCYHEVQMRWLQDGVHGDDENSFYLIGGHFSLKRQMALQHNILFNERISYGGSELSFFQKAYQLGLRLYLKNISVVHETSESFSSLTRKLFKQGQGKAIIKEPLVTLRSLNNFETTRGDEGFIYKLLLTYLNCTFWFGYYSYQKNYVGFLKYLLLSLKGYFDQSRQNNIIKVNAKLQSKKNRGDLL